MSLQSTMKQNPQYRVPSGQQYVFQSTYSPSDTNQRNTLHSPSPATYRTTASQQQDDTASSLPPQSASSAQSESNYPFSYPPSSTYLSTGDYGHDWTRRAFSDDSEEMDGESYASTLPIDYINRFDDIHTWRTQLER